jgi:metallophosphoesterase (TIGR00282 family)
VRLLAIGDVVGGVGLAAILDTLPGLRDEYAPDLVVVNAENAAHGTGTSPRQAKDLLEAGVDVVTGGNHTFRRRELYPLLGSEQRVIRPHNLAVKGPGSGLAVVPVAGGRNAAVINLLGSIFMDSAASPFAVVDELVDSAREQATFVMVDMHAEATSEKIALGRYLDGRVTAVVGTHTHVQTADERVLAGGTAYISDLGMTGPHDSVIGVASDIILNRFLTGAPGRFEVAEGDVRVQGVVVDADEQGLATGIRRIDRPLEG